MTHVWIVKSFDPGNRWDTIEGVWSTEAQAREHVARIRAMDHPHYQEPEAKRWMVDDDV
jgi:hypothetical protein